MVRQRATKEAELDRDHVRLKPVGVHVNAEEASLVQLDLFLPEADHTESGLRTVRQGGIGATGMGGGEGVLICCLP